MAKVKSITNEVPLRLMKDGEVAEVIYWFNDEVEAGEVIQRYKNSLIVIGKHSNYCYPTLFNGCEELDLAKVRILNRGIEIVL